MNVIIPGTWDLFHKGHKALIEYGKMLCGEEGKLLIVVNSDKLSELVGKTPSEKDWQRVNNVIRYAPEGTNVVMAFNSWDTVVSSQDHSPCIWLTGSDWSLKSTSERNNVPETFWEENNIYLLYKDRVPNISSTGLRG